MTPEIERIEERRESLEMSRSMMCKRAGVPVTTYSNYIRRGDCPNISTIEKLATVLGTTSEYIRFGVLPSANLKMEMKKLEGKIATLGPQQQERIIVMMNEIIDSYNTTE